MTRDRRVYAIAVGVTVAAGLGSRALASHLPWWLAKNAGDALYATMVFFAIGVVAPKLSTGRTALAATSFCFAIEFFQLVRAPWLDAIRETLPGRLVLGQGFHAFDLVCYVIGVALAAGIEVSTRVVALRAREVR